MMVQLCLKDNKKYHPISYNLKDLVAIELLFEFVYFSVTFENIIKWFYDGK